MKIPMTKGPLDENDDYAGQPAKRQQAKILNRGLRNPYEIQK